MSQPSNKLTNLWQELKRRKVVRVVSVYAAAAFVILELVDIVTEPFGLPDWTMILVVVLLTVGFIISVILSWIYDVQPEGGIVKTEPVHKVKPEDIPVSKNSWRIATYLSGVIIVCLLALNLFGGRSGTKIDESLEKSIAVLPFHNYSGDPGQDYMCEGLTDEIISNLFKVRSFDEVRSLTSVLPYKDSEKSVTEIAEALNVNYILQGTYKRMGDELKITAQLIESESDNHIWLHDYEFPYNEVMGIPGDIALQIADHLKAFLNVSETEIINSIPTDSLEAYEILKQAGYLINLQGPNAAPLALEFALEAIKIDPKYTDAHAMAGIYTIFQGVYSGQIKIQDAALDAIPYLIKALELDQNNASAHLGNAFINEWARWDYLEAEKEYLKAIELEPNNPLLYSLAAEFFVKMLQLDEFWTIIDKSPEKGRSIIEMIQSHILSGNIKEAYNAIIPIKGEEQMYRWIGELYLWLEEYDSVNFYLEYAMKNEHPDMSTPRFQAYMALAYEKTNNHQQAERIINQLIAKNDTTSVGTPASFLGLYYSGIGEMDSAFYWLEKAFDNRSPEYSWFKVNPAFNNLKDDPRYCDLYERTGHKAYDDYMASKSK